jgi:glucose-6-phosphate dehydrogenase assembly protein OpcA
MAHTVTTLSAWSEEHVRVADVLRALEELRRPEPMPSTRTSVLTLVVVATRRASAERALAAVGELGGRHPARVLTLLLAPDARPGDRGIDAEIRLLGSEAEGRPVWFEDVELAVRGPAADHLDSLIEPFTIADLPVVVWWVDGLPELDDAMVTAADVVLVDARDFGDEQCFETLASLRHTPVIDLSWHRLRPWRELLASLFEGRVARPFLADVRSARVVGRTGPRYLLGGWLVDRLKLPTSEVHLEEAEHVSIEVIARDSAGRRGVFEVTRQSDERTVRARAELQDGPTSEIVVPLPEGGPAWGLADALSRLERDAVYEGALDAAIVLARR